MNGIDSGPGISRWRDISSRFFKEVVYCEVNDRTKKIDEAKDK
jgi:hypothetical protein